MFENIIGNERNKEILRNIIKSKNISHSYMFVGKSGIGKMLFAKEFSKAILCTNDNKSCKKCKSCLEFEGLNNPDFTIIEPEEKTLKINQIREMIKKALEKPIVSNNKVYIINNSDFMTKEAQNSLLKTLEEPPEYITIILIAENDNIFLPTIKSRCTKILFNKINDKEVQSFLEKNNYTNIDNTILKIADGSIGKAISLIQRGYKYENINKVFLNIDNINIIDCINSKDKIFKIKEDVFEILEYINLLFFDKIKTDYKKKEKYINCIKIVEKTKDKLKKNNNYDMTLDKFFITIWEELNG